MWCTSDDLADLVSDLPRFETAISHLAKQIGLPVGRLEVDHIAVRCHQNTTAERWSRGFSQVASLLSKKCINGRPVCLFALAVPLTLGPWKIDTVELPWPGKKYYPHEGWEHIEIVLRGDPNSLHQRVMDLLADNAPSHPGLSFVSRSPTTAGETLPNPTLSVTNGQVTIKFHPWPLRDIVASGKLT